MIRVLIVDDEAPARAKLRQLVARETDLDLVGEAKDGDEAVELLRSLSPDLVFLDVQMPRRDGFEVIEEIGVAEMPTVVFVTAYDEHALRAFEVQALDYLLKPFSPSRFRGLLERVRERLAESGPSEDLVRRMEELLEAAAPSARPLQRLLVEKSEGREILLSVERIDIVRADRNHLHFIGPDGEFTRRGTLKEMVERLDPERFLQINRSEIVRLDAIRELQPWSHGDYRVVLQNGTVLSWSRRFRARVRDEL